jgi:hypothetical protein
LQRSLGLHSSASATLAKVSTVGIRSWRSMYPTYWCEMPARAANSFWGSPASFRLARIADARALTKALVRRVTASTSRNYVGGPGNRHVTIVRFLACRERGFHAPCQHDSPPTGKGSFGAGRCLHGLQQLPGRLRDAPGGLRGHRPGGDGRTVPAPSCGRGMRGWRADRGGAPRGDAGGVGGFRDRGAVSERGRSYPQALS